jgi:hypothetical protein
MTDYIRRYECTGTLDHRDGTPPVECACVATQEHDGTISLDCLAPSNASPPVKWWSGIFGASMDAAVFKGRLENGLPLEAEGTLLGHPGGWNQERGTRAIFDLTGNSHLTVGSADDAADWRFAITNIVFSVPPDRRGNAEGSSGESLPLVLAEIPVSIEQVPDYDAATAQLGGRHSVRVTAEACIPRSVPLEAARELVADLCSLLSIAQGTFVNWIFCEQRDATGRALFAAHHPAVTRPYNGALPLIDPRPPEELPDFIEGVFGRFRDLKDSYQLAVISRACTDVRTDGFLETRCLQLLSVLEYIIGRNAALQGREFVMDNQAFQEALGRLRRGISALLCLAFPSLSKRDANLMTEHLRGFNYTTFKRRLWAAAAKFGVHLDQADVDPLADTRNELVHRAAFATEERLLEFRRVQSVVDKLLMGLLGYRGPYIDSATITRSTSH